MVEIHELSVLLRNEHVAHFLAHSIELYTNNSDSLYIPTSARNTMLRPKVDRIRRAREDDSLHEATGRIEEVVQSQ